MRCIRPSHIEDRRMNRIGLSRPDDPILILGIVRRLLTGDEARTEPDAGCTQSKRSGDAAAIGISPAATTGVGPTHTPAVDEADRHRVKPSVEQFYGGIAPKI